MILLTLDLWGSVLGHIDNVQHVALLCSTNRSLNTLLQAQPARESWIRLVKNITGYETLPFSKDSSHFDLWVKRMICPWLFTSERLVFQAPTVDPDDLGSTMNETLYTLKDGKGLIYQMVRRYRANLAVQQFYVHLPGGKGLQLDPPSYLKEKKEQEDDLCCSISEAQNVKFRFKVIKRG
jgi:hypothetical protein